MSADHLTAPASGRDAFAHWLSGFVDGEGSFILDVVRGRSRHNPRYPRVSFAINLRADDRAILGEIRDYWGVGRVYKVWKNPPGHPGVTFRVMGAHDLCRVVIPHFERYPLRAKKSRDFAIWRRGAELFLRVTSRPRSGRSNWTVADQAEFIAIMDSLKAQRRYEPPEESPPRTHQLSFLM